MDWRRLIKPWSAGDGAFLRSRVARRIFGLLVLSAFVPIATLAYLSMGQVADLLTRQAQQQLSRAAESFGRAAYDRLLLAAAMGEQLVQRSQAAGGGAAAVPSTSSAPYLEAATLIAPGVPQTYLIGTLDPAPEWLRQAEEALRVSPDGNPVVLTVSGVGPRTRLLLVRYQNLPAGRGMLVAEPKSDFIWGDRESLPYLTDLCVMVPSGAQLYCSREMPLTAVATALRGARENNAGHFQWEQERVRQQSAYRQLTLRGHFSGDPWTVVATTPESVANAPVESFKRVFIPVLVASLLFVALLSSTQIRKILVPLELLIAGTRRITRREFGQPVVVNGPPDEFSELAQSFNEMADSLNRQFNSLLTLSEIDRLILSKIELNKIISLVLEHLTREEPAVFAALLAPDRHHAGRAHLTLKPAGGPEQPTKMQPVNRQDLNKFGECVSGVWVKPAALPKSMQRALGDMGASRFYLVPFSWDPKACALLVLGYCKKPSGASERSGQIRGLADRIAVAVATVARDDQLMHQARHDLLTGLPNRLLFKDRLSVELARAHRERSSFALFFLDLDRFKAINDTLGHTAGDTLLKEAAARLRAVLRETDTVARISGDEFTVILPGVNEPRQAGVVAENIINALSRPFILEGQERYVSASVGVAIYPQDGASAEELQRNADTAMYHAKDAGRGTYVFFEEKMNREAVERATLERELRLAIERDELVAYFQPQMYTNSRRMSGAEALVRWHHPTRGLLTPGAFISVAEQTDLVNTLGRLVLRKACAQYRVWTKLGVAPERISVNVSTRQFRDPDFYDFVATTLQVCAIRPECLELEITESLLMDEPEATRQLLTRFNALGVRVAIDDFGTGYSSLAYLKDLAVDVVKIDRAFVKDLTKDDSAGTIAEAIIAMAHSLRKEVVAEGVETEQQLETLRRFGCDQIQGYLYSRPLSPEEFLRFATGGRARVTPSQSPALA